MRYRDISIYAKKCSIRPLSTTLCCWDPYILTQVHHWYRQSRFVGGVCSWGALWRLSLPFAPVFAVLVAIKSWRAGGLLVSLGSHVIPQPPSSSVLSTNLQILVLLERPTDDSIEIAVAFIREVGVFFFPLRKPTKSQRDCLWAIPFCFTVYNFFAHNFSYSIPSESSET